MGRYEVWNYLLPEAVLLANLLKLFFHDSEKTERRFVHKVQDMVLGMLGSNFEPSAYMLGYQLRKILSGSIVKKTFLIKEKIVPYSAANEGMADPPYVVYIAIKIKQRQVGMVQVWAHFRE